MIQNSDLLTKIHCVKILNFQFRFHTIHVQSPLVKFVTYIYKDEEYVVLNLRGCIYY